MDGARSFQIPESGFHIRLVISHTMVSQKFIEEQPQILRLTTPRLKSTPGALFAQDDCGASGMPFIVGWSGLRFAQGIDGCVESRRQFIDLTDGHSRGFDGLADAHRQLAGI